MIISAQAAMGLFEKDPQIFLEKAPELLHRIITTSNRMESIVNNILDFTRSRIGEGLPIQPKPTNFRSISQTLVDEFATIFPARALTVNTVGDVSGNWDSQRLLQMLGNLISNAYRFGEKNSPVALTAENAGANVTFSVVNHGTPIPKAKLEEIFEPFYTQPSDSSSRTAGLGLGLFIVRSIAEAHGGTVAAQSDKNSTCFTVTLPRQLPAALSHERPSAISSEKNISLQEPNH